MPAPRTCPHLDACTASPAHFDAAAGFSGLAALRAITIDLRTVGIALNLAGQLWRGDGRASAVAALAEGA